MDLVQAIFEYIEKERNEKYQYEFYRVNGDSYGHPVPGTKKWDGLIGELLEHVTIFIYLFVCFLN